MNYPIEGSSEKHRDYTGAKLGMWLFLATEVLFFVGPLLLYAAYRYRYGADFAAASSSLNLTIGSFNTAVLLTSSLTMALSVAAAGRGRAGLSMIFLLATIILGGVFLFDKYIEWGAKIGHGIYPSSEGLLKLNRGEVIFFGLYFFTTGLHGLHVLAGVFLLAGILVMAALGRIKQEDFIELENSGLYWHIVDVIWIYLFPLFYLVK